MVDIQIGTAGWAYDDWKGPFYPDYISKNRYLTHYAKYFHMVETNSTHYHIPKSSTLKKWASSVPENFKFCIKAWNQITHIKDYGLAIQNLKIFFDAFQEISNKITYFLLQFPPSFRKTDNHILFLNEILKNIDPEKKVVVELRHNSWFDPIVLKPILNGKTQILGTVYLDDIIPYYPDSQKSYYIRVIGDRHLTKFHKVQRENPKIWEHLMEFMKKYREGTDIVDIFVIFNNHYTGFSPSDSNKLKQALNLPYKDYTKRKSITDFF